MKCERCDQPASVHLTQVVHGKVTKTHLCPACAKKAGLGAESVASLTEYLLGNVPAASATGDRLAQCPECRMTLKRLRKEGRLGCPKCYETFDHELERILQSTHGALRHHGRHPRASAPVGTWREEVAKLKQRLEEAVSAEAYEDAARLRDELRSLLERQPGGVS